MLKHRPGSVVSEVTVMLDPIYEPRNKTLPRDPNTPNLRLLKLASYRNYEHVPTLSELLDQPRRK